MAYIEASFVRGDRVTDLASRLHRELVRGCVNVDFNNISSQKVQVQRENEQTVILYFTYSKPLLVFSWPWTTRDKGWIFRSPSKKSFRCLVNSFAVASWLRSQVFSSANSRWETFPAITRYPSCICAPPSRYENPLLHLPAEFGGWSAHLAPRWISGSLPVLIHRLSHRIPSCSALSSAGETLPIRATRS